MVTIDWTIEWLETKPSVGDLSNVVAIVGWRCSGTDGDTKATAYGTVGLSDPTNGFIPYDQLTKNQVLDWVYANGVDKDAIENSVINNINEQKNPPVVRLPLPW